MTNRYKCIYRENEEEFYQSECKSDSDLWFTWLELRNFRYCPYCGKPITVLSDE